MSKKDEVKERDQMLDIVRSVSPIISALIQKDSSYVNHLEEEVKYLREKLEKYEK